MTSCRSVDWTNIQAVKMVKPVANYQRCYGLFSSSARSDLQAINDECRRGWTSMLPCFQDLEWWFLILAHFLPFLKVALSQKVGVDFQIAKNECRKLSWKWKKMKILTFFAFTGLKSIYRFYKWVLGTLPINYMCLKYFTHLT